MGLCYSADHITKSELRVLKTLDYRINIDSPLVYIETLLKVLRKYYCLKILGFGIAWIQLYLILSEIQFPDLPVDDWYRHCLLVLEAVVLRRDDIYNLLFQGLFGADVVMSR